MKLLEMSHPHLIGLKAPSINLVISLRTGKKRKIVIENGVLSYYRIGMDGESEFLRGSIPLKSYMVRKCRRHEIYLWSTQIGQNQKDLLLHLNHRPENPYPTRVWLAAIRSHIRYANENYLTKMNWTPMYRYFLLQNPSLLRTPESCRSPPPYDPDEPEPENPPPPTPTPLIPPVQAYDKVRVYQVVNKDGVSVYDNVEEDSSLVNYLKYHEIIEINQIELNLQNNCRGRLINGEGWVGLSDNDSTVLCLELELVEEVIEAEPEQIEQTEQQEPTQQTPQLLLSALKRPPVAIRTDSSNSVYSGFSRTTTLLSVSSDGPPIPLPPRSYSHYQISYYVLPRTRTRGFEKAE